MSDLSNAPRHVALSERAAKRIAWLIAREGDLELHLRVAVNGGGCSGFQYSFDFDKQINDDDLVVERDGVKLVVDEISLQYMEGSEVDYVEDMMAAAFTVRNPNAAASCGCGTSFSI